MGLGLGLGLATLSPWHLGPHSLLRNSPRRLATLRARAGSPVKARTMAWLGFGLGLGLGLGFGFGFGFEFGFGLGP